jgi:hypothetical protein
MTIEDRLARVRAAFESGASTACSSATHVNRRWLSGFTGSAGWLLILPDAAWLATDFRYWEQAAAEAPGYAVHQMGERRVVAETVREVAAGSLPRRRSQPPDAAGLRRPAGGGGRHLETAGGDRRALARR